MPSALVVCPQGESRSLLQDVTQEHGDHSHNGTVSGTRFEFDHTIDILGASSCATWQTVLE